MVGRLDSIAADGEGPVRVYAYVYGCVHVCVGAWVRVCVYVCMCV